MAKHSHTSIFTDIQDVQQLVLENGVTPSMKTMHQSSLSKIQPDSWFNIPICVVKAFKQMIETCQNQQQIIKEINERANEREQIAYAKLKKMETLIQDKDENVHKTMDNTEKQIFDKIRKIQQGVENQIQIQEQRLKEVYNNSFQDREYMTKKLSGVEDSTVTRNYIENQLISMENRFRKQQFVKQDQIDKAFNILKEDNLVIPGLVGHGEHFENLRGWVSYTHTFVQHSAIELEEKLIDRMQKDISRALKDYGENFSIFKDQIITQLTINSDRFNTALNTQITQMKQEQNDRLIPIKQEQSTIQNLVQFFETKLEQLKSDIQALNLDDQNQIQFDLIKDQVQLDLAKSKIKYMKQFEKFNEEQKEREENVKKTIESLKAEIRVSNQKKVKSPSNMELTDKVKRQMNEMIQNNIEKHLTQNGQTRANTNMQTISDNGGVTNSQNKINQNSRQSQVRNEVMNSKAKHSMTIQRDTNASLLSVNQNQNQLKTRNSFFQQNLAQARAKSQLDHHDDNVTMKIDSQDNPSSDLLNHQENKTILKDFNSSQIEINDNPFRMRTMKNQATKLEDQNEYQTQTQQFKKRQNTLTMNQTVNSIGLQHIDNPSFRNLDQKQMFNKDLSFRDQLPHVNQSELNTLYLLDKSNETRRFRNSNSSHSSLVGGRPKAIQNIKLINQTNTKIIFSQHAQRQNQVLAVKFESLGALE